MYKKIVLSFLICSFFGFYLLNNAFAAWGEKEIETEKIAVNFAKEVERGGYKFVSTEELKSWIDQKKKMLIIDTMPYEDSYKKQHVPGAVQFEFPIPEVTKLDDKTKAAYEKLLGPDRNRLIVIYCGFTKCTRSHNGAMWAVKLGYKNVYRYPGGIKAWMEADYPIEKVK
ncbi:MAG: rhodanese-like domain-containing protein [Thermodesulfovibrionales bacterium]